MFLGYPLKSVVFYTHSANPVLRFVDKLIAASQKLSLKKTFDAIVSIWEIKYRIHNLFVNSKGLHVADDLRLSFATDMCLWF